MKTKRSSSVCPRLSLSPRADLDSFALSGVSISGAGGVRESVKGGHVGDVKGGQRAPNWTSETCGSEEDSRPH